MIPEGTLLPYYLLTIPIIAPHLRLRIPNSFPKNAHPTSTQPSSIQTRTYNAEQYEDLLIAHGIDPIQDPTLTFMKANPTYVFVKAKPTLYWKPNPMPDKGNDPTDSQI